MQNLLQISHTVTATELFDLRKKKKGKPVPLESGYYQEPIPIPKNFQRSKYFKNCKECSKNKIRKQTHLQCKVCVTPL